MQSQLDMSKTDSEVGPLLTTFNWLH